MTSQYDSYIYYFKKCLEINPKHELAGSYLGLTYTNLGNYEEALKTYNTAIEQNPKSIISHNLKLRLLITQKKWEEALEFSKKCLAIDPFNSEIYLLRGNINQAMNKSTDALNDYSLSIQYNPEQKDAYIGKWQIFQTLGEKESVNRYAAFLSVFYSGTKDATNP